MFLLLGLVDLDLHAGRLDRRVATQLLVEILVGVGFRHEAEDFSVGVLEGRRLLVGDLRGFARIRSG